MEAPNAAKPNNDDGGFDFGDPGVDNGNNIFGNFSSGIDNNANPGVPQNNNPQQFASNNFSQFDSYKDPFADGGMESTNNDGANKAEENKNDGGLFDFM